METVPPVDTLSKCLLDINEPMGKRTRSLFYLRTEGSEQALQVLCEGM